MAEGGLIDIVEPAIPPLSTEPNAFLMAVAVMAVIAAGFTLVCLYRRHRATAWVARLSKGYQQGRHDARASAFLLAAGMIKQLGLHEIAPNTPPKKIEAGAWRVFAEQLSILRYEPDARATPAEMAALFDRARLWIAAAQC
ncbi:MAG: hypothetical protein Q8O37_02365 [Sulfuricellaceae bacterium]|nr:hypothetical protein [Sulfuricellaceae bacterium]